MSSNTKNFIACNITKMGAFTNVTL